MGAQRAARKDVLNNNRGVSESNNHHDMRGGVYGVVAQGSTHVPKNANHSSKRVDRAVVHTHGLPIG